MTEVFVDVFKCPKDWQTKLEALGCSWARQEMQPIADQIKLHGFTKGKEQLPEWIRQPSNNHR